MSALAVITARGGSKRIPRKNIRPFRGKPMLAWPLQAALTSFLFDEVMVSTEDEEIASIARRYGASVPFLRSARAADDFSNTPDVLVEVLETYRARGAWFDIACCIYPTAPFLTAETLHQGYQRLKAGPFDTVIPVAAFGYPIWRALRRSDSGRIELNWPENRFQRSQDLPPAYHDAGQFYWFRIDAFLRERVLMGSNTGSILLPETHVQDIDTEEDWAMAECKHRWIFP
jgi:N-acylneuraminate cytidylyltransferase